MIQEKELNLEFGTVHNFQEAKKLGEILCQCFAFSMDFWLQYCNNVRIENLRTIVHKDRIVGGLALHNLGQWFGGNCIPMCGIAMVGIAPEHRGKGLARELVKHTLIEFDSLNIPISTLFPATKYLYSQLGYEQGGIRCLWGLPTDGIQFKNDAKLLHNTFMLKVEPLKCLSFLELYNKTARINNGYLKRNETVWKKIIEQGDTTIHAYVVYSEDRPEGYIIYNQILQEKKSFLRILDWTATTPAITSCLWRFINTHKSQFQEVSWFSGAVEPKLLMLSEQKASIRHYDYWFLRIVNVEKSLALRGYPSCIEAELHLEIHDSLLSSNNDRFILTVCNGIGKVSKGGSGHLKLDISSLVPMYTNLFSPLQLLQMGRIEATDEKIIDIATSIFAGSSPSMIDFY
ncbi:MAG: GNAT family N-acetyltransferase [Waterburya sp.]